MGFMLSSKSPFPPGWLPIQSSYPKSVLSGMNACMTTAFLKGHGEKTTRKTRIPAQGIAFAFQAAHPQIAHSDGISDGFTNPASAHTAPAGMNLNRGNSDADAAAKIPVISKADSVVSQILSGAVSMGGATAQRNPARF